MASPAALALVDEYDEMLANVKGQGDPLGLVEARGETYADFVTAITSTPSRGLIETELDARSGLTFWKPGDPEAVESAIWRLWQSGTRHHFCWLCLHCLPGRRRRKRQRPRRSRVITRKTHLGSDCIQRYNERP